MNGNGGQDSFEACSVILGMARTRSRLIYVPCLLGATKEVFIDGL